MARRSTRRAAPAVAPVVLQEALDLPAAAPLTAELLARRGQDLTIDASGAQRVGAQCLQVLLAARASWAADGHAFRIIQACPEFVAAVTLLGAADLADGADPAAGADGSATAAPAGVEQAGPDLGLAEATASLVMHDA